jgi:hypothetical protein
MTQKEFLQEWVNSVKRKLLKSFPKDFIKDHPAKEIQLPSKTLILGPELFGAYELLDVFGNMILNAANITEAKYILYANREKPVKINIPIEEEKVKSIVKEYEFHLDSILKEVEKDFKLKFPDSQKFLEISSHLFQTLNIQRY